MTNVCPALPRCRDVHTFLWIFSPLNWVCHMCVCVLLELPPLGGAGGNFPSWSWNHGGFLTPSYFWKSFDNKIINLQTDLETYHNLPTSILASELCWLASLWSSSSRTPNNQPGIQHEWKLHNRDTRTKSLKSSSLPVRILRFASIMSGLSLFSLLVMK